MLLPFIFLLSHHIRSRVSWIFHNRKDAAQQNVHSSIKQGNSLILFQIIHLDSSLIQNVQDFFQGIFYSIIWLFLCLITKFTVPRKTKIKHFFHTFSSDVSKVLDFSFCLDHWASSFCRTLLKQRMDHKKVFFRIVL